MHKLAINADICSGIGFGDAVKIIKSVGFDGCFTVWKSGAPVDEWAEQIAGAGLIYQSMHAPFSNADKLWEEGAEGDAALAELTACLADCARCGVPYMIVHPIIGMDKHTPCPTGTARLARLVESAEKAGVKLAFENVEGIEYLKYVLAAFDSEYAGFCWDTGHQMCYNRGEELMPQFGSRLLCTHINDNLGMSDKNEFTWLDDSHMLPFDGIVNWEKVAAQLDEYNYNGIMTCELIPVSRPGRHTHERYAQLSPEAFTAAACERMKRLDAMRK